ncbi:MAG TPA: CRISPR-associated endonuclease Cas1 [Propionibacteriaceae bacterium]|nr:CRISPR-associated endonuclease Cas1 [Propionibacteriaceae bacterium]
MKQPSADVANVISLNAEDLLHGQRQLAATYDDDDDDDDWIGETVILDGVGVSLRVNRGQLICADGEGQERRERRISRNQAAAGQIRRLLILGDGMITTEAMAWCHNLGIGLVVCDRAAAPLLAGGPALYRHGSLTKAQALATVNGTAMRVVHTLLDRRLADQARITRTHLDRPDCADAIDVFRTELRNTGNAEQAMVVEMQAADQYWSAWNHAVHLNFAAQDRRRVPHYWLTFGGRTTPLVEAGTNRHAATPTNAMINFGMRLAEIETTLACHALGLDPYIGLAHANHPHRPAFVLDLMEAVRGVVEETVWQLTMSRTFRKADFAEGPTGEVRILPPFSHAFAAGLLPSLRAAVAPVAEDVAKTLLDATHHTGTVPTALTRRNSKSSVLAGGGLARSKRPRSTATQLWTCPQCGAAVNNSKHVRCQGCINADARQTTEIRGRRGNAIAARKRAYRAWEKAGGLGDLDPNTWNRIAAGLKTVKLSDIMQVTGVSKSFASTIRSGKYRPHVSHWPALAVLAESAART